MDAREVIHKALCDAGFDNVKDDDAPFIIAHLHLAGFTILHDSENHGPTLERAAQRADKHGTRAKTIDGQRTGYSIAAAIRQLKEDRL